MSFYFVFRLVCINFASMIRNILLVALGGAVGSVARYLLSTAVQEQAQSVFPWGTMTVNVLGCLIIGFVTALAAGHGVISPSLKLILTTGFCGGFTTFSTFMNETVALGNGSNNTAAVLYVALSVVLGFAAAVAGLQLGRMF